jgi:hypothetical protein
MLVEAGGDSAIVLDTIEEPLVSPPRERPMQRLRALFFAIGGVLMHPHDCAVDHLNFAVISL